MVNFQSMVNFFGITIKRVEDNLVCTSKFGESVVIPKEIEVEIKFTKKGFMDKRYRNFVFYDFVKKQICNLEF